MASLRKVLLRHVAQAGRGNSKQHLNRLVEFYYTSPGLGNVVRSPVKGARGQSAPSAVVDPDA